MIFRILITIYLFSTIFFVAAPVAAETLSNYPKTVRVLLERYKSERNTAQEYRAFAEKAVIEKHPNIAYLFRAMAVSESIHAKNCRRILDDLGVEVKDIPRQDLEISSTKENLHKASAEEIKEIDHEYPSIIKEITPEGNETAIRFLNYAWQAEKQHRGLIRKLEAGTRRFFWLLKMKFRKKQATYFVCGTCGSTLTELPEDKCPICGKPVSGYRAVEMAKKR
jgi:rubrerythrin